MENAIGMTDEEFKKINSVFDELAALKAENRKLKAENDDLKTVVGKEIEQLQADKAELINLLKDVVNEVYKNEGSVTEETYYEIKQLLAKHEAK